MYSYIIRRLAFGLLTVFGVSIVVFVVMRVLPGDPLVAIFGPEGYTKLTDAERANYMAQLGLSDPLIVQYLHWMRDIATAVSDARSSASESVADMILRRGPLTAEIAHTVGGAVVDRRHPGGDRQRAPAEQHRRQRLPLPQHPVPGGAGLLARHADRSWPCCSGSAIARRWPACRCCEDPLGNLQIVIGPAFVLGLGQAAYIARMARSSLLEVIREDYVRTARAKGLNGRLVIALHALPNALLPVITLSGILLGFVLAGSIPVERAFGTPGLGYAMFTAVSERDVFVMQNLVFLYRDRVRDAEHRGRSDDRLA